TDFGRNDLCDLLGRRAATCRKASSLQPRLSQQRDASRRVSRKTTRRFAILSGHPGRCLPPSPPDMNEIAVTIAGTGSYVPERILTNAELSTLVDTSDEWIFTRTGIRERRIAAEGEFTSHMATKAAERALEQAGLDPAEVELIIVATITTDTLTPATACY